MNRIQDNLLVDTGNTIKNAQAIKDFVLNTLYKDKVLPERFDVNMEMKKFLAYTIVRMYHGKKAADAALDEFERVICKKTKPEFVLINEIIYTCYGID